MRQAKALENFLYSQVQIGNPFDPSLVELWDVLEGLKHLSGVGGFTSGVPLNIVEDEAYAAEAMLRQYVEESC